MKINQEQIGINYFLNKIECKSQYGKLALKKLQRIDSKEKIIAEQKLLLDVINFDKSKKNAAMGILSSIKNITLVLQNIKNKSAVEITDLFEVKVQAMHTRKLINILGSELFEFKSVDEIISILDPNNENNFTFRLYEVYDSELADILKQKKQIEHKYYKSDDSEKPQILAMRNKIIIDEKIRIDHVIYELVQKLSVYIDNMITNCEVLTKCDLTIAKSFVYEHYNYCLVEDGEEITLESAVLPIVYDHVNEYTALDINLKRGSTLIVGANMGGKSTILKNLAFNIYLVNYGFLPLAKKFVFPFLTDVIFIQTFEDSKHGLSRFGSEIVMLNEALSELNENTIFLVDEFASSTNPSEGYLFVKSLINYCNTLSSFTVLTSHYDNLSSECDTYVVSGIKEDSLNSNFNIYDSMDYSIYKSNNNVIPKQALIVAKYMNINEDYLKILSANYKKEV